MFKSLSFQRTCLKRLSELTTVVWPNGGASSWTMDEREAAIRYCFDKPDVQVLDVEYDIYDVDDWTGDGDDSDDDKDDDKDDDDEDDEDDGMGYGEGEEYDVNENNEFFRDEDVPKYGRHNRLGWPAEDPQSWDPRSSSWWEGNPTIARAGSRRLVLRHPLNRDNSKDLTSESPDEMPSTDQEPGS
jgi:hypothetical protein